MIDLTTITKAASVHWFLSAGGVMLGFDPESGRAIWSAPVNLSATTHCPWHDSGICTDPEVWGAIVLYTPATAPQHFNPMPEPDYSADYSADYAPGYGGYGGYGGRYSETGRRRSQYPPIPMPDLGGEIPDEIVFDGDEEDEHEDTEGFLET